MLHRFGTSLGMAFTLFSKIPVPTISWEEDNMRYVMAAFPLVGLVEALFLALWFYLCVQLGATAFFCAAGATLIPLLFTGGIHMDGFCDVTDALSSHAQVQKKREILKDAHVGAFAVIGSGMYLIAYLALMYEVMVIHGPQFWVFACLCGIFVLSRVLSSIATLCFPKSSEEGMLSFFSQSAQTQTALHVVAGIALVSIIFVAWQSPLVALLDILFGCGILAGVYHLSQKEFGGMSGDIAGWLLQVAELVFVAVLLVV